MLNSKREWDLYILVKIFDFYYISLNKLKINIKFNNIYISKIFVSDISYINLSLKTLVLFWFHFF